MARIESLEMRGIVKEFGGARANDGVSLRVASGEVLALLGENGAGKTTLMNVLYGLYAPDGGEILVNGLPAAIRSPRDAIRLGIGMVHQHFMLIPRHTVAENVALGLREAPLLGAQGWAACRIEEFCGRYGFKVDPLARVWRLSAGEQQRVEVLKALIKGAELLILDEPTSVLTDGEAADLFAAIRRMTGEGKSVILITHKLPEVLSASDRVVVLRRGRVAGTLDTATATAETLAILMTTQADGRRRQAADVSRSPFHESSSTNAPRTPVLKVSGLTVLNDLKLPAVKSLDFSVAGGEILGVAGVSGNGQRELAEALTGLRPAAAGGFSVEGRDAAAMTCRELRSLGVRHIPEERLRLGVVGAMTVAENAVLSGYGERPFCEGVLINGKEIERHAEDLIRTQAIATPSPKARASGLSGGNIQKLILGRETRGFPSLIVASHPACGLDIGAAGHVRERLLEMRRQGCAILLISEDLEEVLLLSDRVAVMFEGAFMAVMKNESLDRSDIMLLMAGGRKDHVEA